MIHCMISVAIRTPDAHDLRRQIHHDEFDGRPAVPGLLPEHLLFPEFSAASTSTTPYIDYYGNSISLQRPAVTANPRSDVAAPAPAAGHFEDPLAHIDLSKIIL